MKKLEVSDIAGDVNSEVAIENSLACPQNLSIELPHDAGSPLLDIYLGEGKPGCQTNMCVAMSTATLFTTEGLLTSTRKLCFEDGGEELHGDTC